MKRRSFLSTLCGLAYGSLCILFLALAIGAGCTSETGPTDGGTLPDPNKPASCTPGTYCLRVAAEQVRSCDVLLNGPAGQAIESIGFGAAVIGQSLQKGQRLGLSFVFRQDQASNEAAAVVQVPKADQGKDIKWEVAQARCFDAKGNLVDAPKVTFAKE